MSESILVSKIIRRLNQCGNRVCKNHGTAFSKRGRPDVEGLQRVTGYHIAIEVKKPGKENTTTAKQWAWLYDVVRTSENARAGVATSVQQAERIADGTENQNASIFVNYHQAKSKLKRQKRIDLPIDPGAIGR